MNRHKSRQDILWKRKLDLQTRKILLTNTNFTFQVQFAYHESTTKSISVLLFTGEFAFCIVLKYNTRCEKNVIITSEWKVYLVYLQFDDAQISGENKM